MSSLSFASYRRITRTRFQLASTTDGEPSTTCEHVLTASKTTGRRSTANPKLIGSYEIRRQCRACAYAPVEIDTRAKIRSFRLQLVDSRSIERRTRTRKDLPDENFINRTTNGLFTARSLGLLRNGNKETKRAYDTPKKEYN